MSLLNSFTTNKITEKMRRPWVLKTGIVLVSVLVLFILVLFFAGPPILKSYLTTNLSNKLGRKVSVGKVHINPLMLSVTIDDFTLAEHDGKTSFVAFKQLYVNAQLASIVLGGPVLSEIRLKEPLIWILRGADNSYNFQDIINRLSKTPAEAQQKTPKSMRFSLNYISISKGQIKFDDRLKGRKHEINDLNITIPFLSNLFYRVDDYIEPSFSAAVNGAAIRLKGQSKPFGDNREFSLNLVVKQLGLNEYLAYIPKKLNFTLPSGTLDADINISFVQPKERAPSLQLSGSAALNNLVLNEAKEVPILRLKSLNVVLGCIEPLVKRFTVDSITLSEMELFVRRDHDGRLNLANLVEPGDKKEPMPYFLVRKIDLNSTVVHVRDEQRAQPFETTLCDINLVARDITSEKDKAGQVELSATGYKNASLKAAADIVLEPLTVSKLDVQIADLRLPQRGSKTDIIHIGKFDVTGGTFEFEERKVIIDEISLAKSQFNIQRDSKGLLNLSEITGGKSEKAETEAFPPSPQWQYGVKKVALDNIGLRWHDEMPVEETANIGIEKIQGNIENISSIPNSRAKLSLKALLGRSGKVNVEGNVITVPQVSAKLNLKASNIPILPAQPYFGDKVNIRITDGTLSAQGSLNVQLGKQAHTQYQGNVQVSSFASVDNVNQNNFLNWEALNFKDLKVSTEPLDIVIEEILLSNFYSRLIVNSDGSINVQHVIGREEESRQALIGKVKNPVPTAVSQGKTNRVLEKPTETAKPKPVKIGQVLLQGGRVNFSDRFIKPNYNVNLTQINGSVKGLSSDLDSTADVEIHSKVDDSAPVEILGKVNPLSGNLFLDLTASAKGVDLPTATPYSARYVGYPITKGKLSMDVKYHIENRNLSAENRVMLDQLTFGGKVESPKATKLPVLLAVALLKDRNGVIDIKLPISGSLDDPKFSVGGIILKVIINLITKAVTSPFALLGKLLGSGEELSFVEFEHGRADLDKTARDKLSSLVKALENRPALKLDIIGRVDPSTDKEGLRRLNLEHKVKTVKFKSLAAKANGPSSLEEVSIDPTEYPKLLKQAYSKEKFQKPRNVIGMAKDLPVSEMEKLMLANITVSDDDLRQLAIKRAKVVADAIVKAGDVATERVFVLEPKLKTEADEAESPEKGRANRVDFSLK